MTLLIACFLIYGFELNFIWYIVSTLLWVLHLQVHKQ